MALNNEKLAGKVEQLENRVSDHDKILLDVIEEFKKIIDTPKPRNKNVVGFISATGKTKKKVGDSICCGPGTLAAENGRSHAIIKEEK